jgi:hypothetical protein
VGGVDERFGDLSMFDHQQSRGVNMCPGPKQQCSQLDTVPRIPKTATWLAASLIEIAQIHPNLR